MKKEKVLIIEDELDLLDLLDFNLTRKGFITAGALDGSEGLSKAESFRPDLVILDLMLPGLDGWEVCRRLKQKRKDIKVLMLTAKCMPEDKVKGLETGADDYMTKPFSVKELVIRVEKLLTEKRQKNLHRSVIHELSNRITTLGAYSRLIEGAEDGNTARKYIQSVCRQVDSTEELIHEAGIFLDADLMELKPEPCGLYEVLKIAADAYRELASRKGVTIRIEAEENIEVITDKYAFKQVIFNLAGNAVKYARTSGEVELRATKVDGKILVSIRDNGIGIPAVDLPHVFDQGFRASNVPSTVKGSGFGLYIVKVLCERLGAAMSVKSTVGEGTEFCITLPDSAGD
ncbi:MAG: response regulator [Deltaproteobacteria bacterium]|nr:response regulator [Deltaproteobacteria bacterium]